MHFIADNEYAKLVADLAEAYMRAATTTGTDLHDVLVEVLADADIMPERCRADLAA
ncbi:hypothetical protein [Cypionkella psychrotolerans]|uniref:hypothetical protein n=1 Tax=Cypionkella psychrotolerans TaxID=1678131 RepID=UPI000AFA1E7C|nr:hypothetical protein [Cypionkella psychrotolerans]